MVQTLIFWNAELVPDKIKEEYLKRWSTLTLPTFDEFHKIVEKWEETWFTDVHDVRRAYNDYVRGVVGNRLPRGLPYYPINEAYKVAVEANAMIIF